MKKTICLLGLLAGAAWAADGIVAVPLSTESLAFARYIAWLHEPDPFTGMGAARVTIEASLADGQKQSRFVAQRDIGESERSEYGVIESSGDAAARALIAQYLDAQAQVEDLPLSSVLITPNNYRFRAGGVAMDEGRVAYVYRITPRHKRAGLVRGELWIDAETGLPLRESGRLVKTPKGAGRMEIVRETVPANGVPAVRVTHVTIRSRHAGLGYLRAIEYSATTPAQVSE
jgi:hypothetical protein